MFKKLGKKIINHYEKKASCSCSSDSVSLEPCCETESKSQDDCCEKTENSKGNRSCC